MGKFAVSLTNAKNDADRATVGFVVANAAAGSDQESMVFLSTGPAWARRATPRISTRRASPR